MKSKKIIHAALITSGLLFAVGLAVSKKGVQKSELKTKSLEQIDEYILRQMRRLLVPGLSLAVVEKDRIIHNRGFGRKRPGGEAPSLQTPFSIGSLTKSMTAVAVMQQVEAGKVDLDDPVEKYLPWFTLSDPQAAARITVRHLLNQTSGLPVSAGMTKLAQIVDRTDTANHLADLLRKITPKHRAGDECEYCNLNYDLLGLIIEQVSGESYAEYIKNHIFRPLNMNHSYTLKSDALQNGLAVGYRYWFGIPFPSPNLPVPLESIASGQLFSCAEDMARYLTVHINNGRYGKIQILSEESMQTLHQGVNEFIMMGIASGRYAMGWLSEQIAGDTMLSHGGNVPEYSAFMGFLPDQKIGLVLLVNSDPFGLPPILGEVGQGAMALLANQKPGPMWTRFIPWLMRGLILIPTLQIIDYLTTLKSIRSWNQNPHLVPGRKKIWWKDILLPFFPNLTLIALPIYLKIKKMMGYLNLFMPDLFWTSLVSGSLALLSTIQRINLIIKIRRA